MNGPYLVRMDDAQFADVPNKVVPRTVRLADPGLTGDQATEWIFTAYCEKLISKNEKLQEWIRQYFGRMDDAACWTRLTMGQRIVYSLASLDGQVKNGGITQFFWNCPDLISPAGEALSVLDYPELLAEFGRALESLIGNKDRWLELRNQSHDEPESFWEPFQATYDLLDLSWFDGAYFETYGPELVRRLLAYIREHKGQFIES